MCRVDGFYGGVERHILQVARRLDSSKFKPVIVAISNEGELLRQAKELGLDAEFLPMASRFYLKEASDRLLEIAQKWTASLIHTFGLRSNALARQSSERLAIPWIIRLPNINSTDYTNRFRGWISHWYNNRLIREASVLQVISPMLKQYVEGWADPPRKVYLIPNGLDLDYFNREKISSSIRKTLNISKSTPLIGSTGRLVPIKGYDILIRAFKRIREHLPDAMLMLVGEGPIEGRLKRHARRLGLEESVHFTGYQADIRPYLAAFDLFVCSSHSEGMPHSVLEAMAMKVPVVSTRVGAVDSIIQHNRDGMLVPGNHIEALAGAIETMLYEKKRTEGIIQAAYQRMQETFSLDVMMQKIHSMYECEMERYS